uniref:Insulin-like domain-containing protein n=1 Tax=Apteryx owenii TaxID=8824 RepID=A0A8B9NXR6_APTOW
MFIKGHTGLGVRGAQSGRARPPSPAGACGGLLFIRAVIFTCGGSRWKRNPLLEWEMLKDFYNLNDYIEYVPVADDVKELLLQIEEAVQKDRGGTGIANPMGSNNFLWAKYPRRKRESLGLAGMCCKWGCTKAEISTICRV